MLKPEQLAQMFHDEYERLAPEFGYTSRKSSAVPWINVPEPNKSLMIATAGKVLEGLTITDDALYEKIVEVFERAAFRGEWEYPGEMTALLAADKVADIIIKNFKGILYDRDES